MIQHKRLPLALLVLVCLNGGLFAVSQFWLSPQTAATNDTQNRTSWDLNGWQKVNWTQFLLSAETTEAEDEAEDGAWGLKQLKPSILPSKLLGLARAASVATQAAAKDAIPGLSITGLSIPGAERDNSAAKTCTTDKANSFCGGPFGEYRKKLTEAASAAACKALAKADPTCGTIYYHAASLKQCRCVLRGEKCKHKPSSTATIYNLPVPCGLPVPSASPSSTQVSAAKDGDAKSDAGKKLKKCTWVGPSQQIVSAKHTPARGGSWGKLGDLRNRDFETVRVRPLALP